jgi:hypothetical protein
MGMFAFRRMREQEAARTVASKPLIKKVKTKSKVKNGNHDKRDGRQRVGK